MAWLPCPPPTQTQPLMDKAGLPCQAGGASRQVERSAWLRMPPVSCGPFLPGLLTSDRAAQGQSGRGPTPAPGEAGCWPQSQSLGGGAQGGSRLEASWGPREVSPGLLSSSCHCCRDSFPSLLVRVYTELASEPRAPDPGVHLGQPMEQKAWGQRAQSMCWGEGLSSSPAAVGLLPLFVIWVTWGSGPALVT